MSTKTLKEDKTKAIVVVRNAPGMISHRCLGIVLKRTVVHRRHQHSTDYSSTPTPAAISQLNGYDSTTATTTTTTTTTTEDWMFESGYLVFQDFQEENRQCFWNRTLVDSVNGVEYLGYVAPGTLLVGGNEYYLEAIRSAWARRVLKSPVNFLIARLGDVTGLEMQVIPQTQFTPLPEALCLVISELNSDKDTASLEVIFARLQDRFSDMIVPNQDIVYVSLGKLIKDRKVYHTSDGYFIVTPETYHVTTMPTMPERPLLLTNEEAIQRLHGGQLLSPRRPASADMRTRSIQTNMDELSLCARDNSPSSERNVNSLSRLERSGSLRLSRKEKHKSEEADRASAVVRSESMRLSPEKSKSLIKDINLKSSLAHQDVEKGEKVSVFSKLFRRSGSKRRKSSKSPAKYSTFSSQFPPLEWSDPNIVHYHSRSTQTLDGRRSSSSFSRLLTMGSDSGLVSSTRFNVDQDHNQHHNHHHHHRNSMHRPLSSVTLSNGAAMSNGVKPSTTLSHKLNDISSANNNNSSNATNNNNNNNLAAASSSSPPSMKSKTDSLTRLREHDKYNHVQLRVRSSTLDCVNPTGQSDNHQLLNLTTNPTVASTSSSGPAESSAVALLAATTPLSPSKTTNTSTTSGLPVRKIHSHSCIVLQESPSAKRRSLKAMTTSSSSNRGQSPASATTTPTAPTSNTTGLKSSPSRSLASSKTPSKIVNTDRPVSSYIGYSSSSSPNHRTSTTSTSDVNRMDEAKVKNTELARNVVDESSKLQNRWPAHGLRNGASGETSNLANVMKGGASTSGSTPTATATTTTTTTMNNVWTSPSKKSPAPSKNYRHSSAIKCVNKLHGSPQMATSSTTSPSSTAAVRPTQAIKPLTNDHQVDPDVGAGGAAAKLAAEDKTSLAMTPSPSFNKSFDIESSAFKSITAQKLLKGASINSIDTLVEVNMAAESRSSNDEDSTDHHHHQAATSGRRTTTTSCSSTSSNNAGHHQPQQPDVGGAASSSSSSAAAATSSYRRKVLNYSAPIQGKQSSAVQPRLVGEAHKVVPGSASEERTTADQSHEDSLDRDLKKEKTVANQSEPITKVMAVI